jgi:hypothetical protein
MGRADHFVPRRVNQLLPSLGLRPPEDENDKVGLLVDDSDHFVGEPLPTFTAVGARLPRAHSQDRVEKEDALERPPFEVPMVGCYPQVVLQLAEDVLERWRRLDAARYRKQRPCAWPAPGYGSWPRITTFTPT